MAITTLQEAQNGGVVLGLGGTGNPVPRRDIDDLLLNFPDCFNLLCLALNDLQKEGEKGNKMGYYQIAGIHGMPLTPWDSVKPATATRKSAVDQVRGDNVGYCAHSTITFATWHRPYLAMLEQTIYDRMAKIAELFPKEEQKQVYRKALKDFRLPYWDYFKPRGGEVRFPGNPNVDTLDRNQMTSFAYDFKIPMIFTRDEIMLRSPESKNELQRGANPFRSFRFPSKNNEDSLWVRKVFNRSGQDVDIDYWKPVTARYPDATPDPVTQLNQVLNMRREQRNEYTNDMILWKGYEKFGNFATNGFGEASTTAGSLEDLHNKYHGSIGGGGQMGDPAAAAFDPVFWIHHCQIDRVFAIWQAARPNEWFVDNSPASKAPLYPFRSPKPEQAEYWSSKETRDTKRFGYYYVDADYADAATTQQKYREKYDWAVRFQENSGKRKTYGQCPPSMLPASAEKYEQSQVFNTGTIPKMAKMVAQSATFAATSAQKVVGNIVGAAKPAIPSSSIASAQPVFTKVAERVLAGKLHAQFAAPAGEEPQEDDVDRRWYIDTMVERLALNGSFTTFFFIGPFDDNDENSWAVAPTLAGTSYNFASAVELCDNCGDQEAQAQIVTSTTPITPILMDYVESGQLADLSPQSVEPFLLQHLKWRIKKFAEGRIDPRTVRGLRIGISTKAVPLAGGDPTVQEFPHIVEQIIGNAS